MSVHRVYPKPWLWPSLHAVLFLLFSLSFCAAQDDQDPTKAARALLDSVAPLVKNNQIDEAIQKLHEAYQLAMQAKDGDLVVEICLVLGAADLTSGEEQEAQKAYESALYLLEKAGANEMIIDSLQGAISISRAKNRHDSQLKLLQMLADTYGRVSNFKAQAATLADQVGAYDPSTEMPALCDTLEHQLIPLYQKLNDHAGLAGSWYGEGKCRESAGDIQDAIADYKKSVEAIRVLDDKSSLAEVLDGAGEALRGHGRAAEALPMAKESVSIRKDLGDPRAYAKSLNDLAITDEELGYLPDAVNAIEECVRITHTVNDPDALATALTNEAAVYRDVGRIDEAFNVLKESLQVSHDACLTSDAKQAMKVMATVYAVSGEALKASAAEAVASDTTDICADKTTGGTHSWNAEPSSGRVRMLPAALAKRRSRYGRIEALQATTAGGIDHGQEPAPASPANDAPAPQQDEKTQGDKEPAYMTTHNMSIAMVQMGIYPKAIANFEAELKKAEAEHDPAASASAYDGLGYAYAESSQFTLAESSLLEAERLRHELGNPRAIAATETNLAGLYTRMGRYYDALNIYDQVERTAASLQDIQFQIKTLLTTAELYRHLRSYDQAFDDAQHAFQMSQKTGFRPLTAEAQQTMGLIQLARENYEDAETLFRAAAQNQPADAVLNEGLVEVYLGTGRYAEAEKELARATPEIVGGADSTYRLQYYTQRGIARLGLRRFPEAIADFNSAVQESEEMRSQLVGLKSTGFLDSGTFGGRVRPYRGMIETFAELALSGIPMKASIGDVPTDAPTTAFHYAELARGRSLTEKLASSRIDELRKQVPATVVEEEQQITDRLNKLVQQHNQINSDSPPTPEEAAEFAKLRADAKAHFDSIEKNYPLYARVFRPGIIPVEDLPIGKDEAVLEYAIGIHNIFLFLIAQDHKVHCYELPISVEQAETKVRVFRNLIVAKRFSPALAYDLFLNLLGNVVPYPDLPRHLVIVPDGFLALLPFEALNTAQTGDPSFLAAQHSISYAQSASVLTWTRKFNRTPAAKPLFALADPIFASSDPRLVASAPAPQQAMAATTDQNETPAAAPEPPRSGEHLFPRLPETETEVDTLASIMGVAPRPPDVVTGADATKATIQKTDLSAYRYLHFATHAAALGEPGRVNEPFLVLTQVGNPPGDDGLLKMSEIMDLKLNSDLVVLGACDTGGGDILEGDGVASLASAFQFAGAESVVLSLWELPSEASLLFMQNFYRRLKEGYSKTEAMELSRDAMRRRYADPYYWAVFALYSGASS